MFKSIINYPWVPSVYLMQGLAFAFVIGVSPVLYKTMGLPNSEIAFYTSLFIFPWVLKFLLAPALEKLASKRTFTLVTQFLIAGVTGAIALNLCFSGSIYLTHLLFIFIALLASIHDINVDGIYLESLTFQTQARLIGIRTVFYQFGKLLAQGGIVFLAGLLVTKINFNTSWTTVILLLSLFILIVAFYNQGRMPINLSNKKLGFKEVYENTFKSYHQVFKELVNLPHLIGASIFIVVYNFPDTQLNKIIPLYMLDPVTQGGLQLNLDTVAFIQGICGTISMLAGITISGFLLEKYSLKNCLIPFTLLTSLANASFLLLNPSQSYLIYLIFGCVVISQFFFGLSNGAYMLYLIKLFSKGQYSMSLYALATALMLFGMMLAGSISGWLQTYFGYTHFFIWILVCNFLILFLSIYQVRKVL